MTRRKRSDFALGIAASLFGMTMLSAAPAPAQPTPPAQPGFALPTDAEVAVPGEIIVKLKPNAAAFTDDALSAQGLEPVAGRQVTSGGELIVRLETAPAAFSDPPSARALMEQTENKARELEQLPNVEYAEPNYLMFPLRNPDDPRFSQQWHYLAEAQSAGGIGLPGTWNTNRGKASVVVAVIDTGILPNHPDIVGSPNRVGGYDLITDAWRANDSDARDAEPTDTGDAVQQDACLPRFGFTNPPSGNSWHGTHVAGTVGVGRTNNAIGVAGVNWDVTVVPIRVLGRCGGTMSDIADAIRWAAGMAVPGVPANPNPARIINMSLGGMGACSMTYQNAIDDVLARNVTVVVAAGNSAADASGFRPASCNGVITVAAADDRGHLASRYSNFGQSVEIMAPGGELARDDNADGAPDGVLSMVEGGYAFYNGTSMAAPHVAGVAALWLAKDGSLTPAQVLQRLQANARPRTTSDGCPPNTCGAGLLTAAGAEFGGLAPSTPVPVPMTPIAPTPLPIVDTPSLPMWAVIILALVLVLFELSRQSSRRRRE